MPGPYSASNFANRQNRGRSSSQKYSNGSKQMEVEIIKEHQDPNDDIEDFRKYTLINNNEVLNDLLNDIGSSAGRKKENNIKTSLGFNQTPKKHLNSSGKTKNEDLDHVFNAISSKL